MNPDLIQIETTTLCNASCWMCPRPKATRSNHDNLMSEEVFRSTVLQAVEMGVTTILPFIDGEPLMDSRMVEFVEWIAKNTPSNVIVGWYTNGERLTEEITRRLLATGRIPWFNVSMQGGNKETLERNMGTSWDRTIENVERLIRINRELGGVTQVRANMCVGGPSKDSVADFRARWEKFPEVLICLGSFSNFGGMSRDEHGEAPWKVVDRQVCARGTRHLYVAWNGDVIQCCFDLKQTITYGNVGETPLREIWDSEKARESRRAHFELDVKNMPPICRSCNASKFHG